MSTPAFVTSILDQFYTAAQVDLLHLAMTNLLEMISAGEVDIFLDQREKTLAQKKAFIQKIIAGVECPELKQGLQAKLAEGEVEFFRERNLEAALTALQKAAQDIVIVKLKVAVEFKEADLREMVAVLEEQLEAPAALDIQVEHSLIGGAIVQYGTAIRDYSLRSRLEQFRDHWKKAVVEA
jgi:F0F1-type ATP synthase delta subunit